MGHSFLAHDTRRLSGGFRMILFATLALIPLLIFKPIGRVNDFPGLFSSLFIKGLENILRLKSDSFETRKRVSQTPFYGTNYLWKIWVKRNDQTMRFFESFWLVPYLCGHDDITGTMRKVQIAGFESFWMSVMTHVNGFSFFSAVKAELYLDYLNTSWLDCLFPSSSESIRTGMLARKLVLNRY